MNIEIVLGVVCAILLYVTWETIKLKKKQKEHDTKRKQRKAGSPRKGNRKSNRSNGKATNSK